MRLSYWDTSLFNKISGVYDFPRHCLMDCPPNMVHLLSAGGNIESVCQECETKTFVCYEVKVISVFEMNKTK